MQAQLEGLEAQREQRVSQLAALADQLSAAATAAAPPAAQADNAALTNGVAPAAHAANQAQGPWPLSNPASPPSATAQFPPLRPEASGADTAGSPQLIVKSGTDPLQARMAMLQKQGHALRQVVLQEQERAARAEVHNASLLCGQMSASCCGL